MQPKYLKILLTGTLVEGLLVLVIFLLQPSEQENARLFGFSYLRLGLALGFLLLMASLFVILLRAVRDQQFMEKCLRWIAGLVEKDESAGKRLFKVQGGLVVLLVALVEAFLLTFFSIPPRLQPFIIWAGLVVFQTWLILRIVYTSEYRRRPNAAQRLRSGWRSWSTTQKQVFFLLAVIGLVYFLAFIPGNLNGMHADEYIMYPDVVRMLTPGSTGHETLQHMIVSENFWYGYPYFLISAVVLLIPRLIFGQAFGEQVQLNMLLLRQIISILPMILSIGLLVYMITGFKSKLKAVGLYVFMLLVPGIVMYCYRFWHPDSLVLLMVVGTIYFLKRDEQRFGRDFFYTAITCGMAAVIKYWGFFFFLTIGIYLLKGALARNITAKRMLLLGSLFILVMGLTIILSSPTLFVPWSFDMLVKNFKVSNTNILQGFNEPDPLGAYRTGMGPWLTYIDIYFMKPYFFFFAFASLLLGSFLGTSRQLNRLLLSWCIVLAVYFMGFMVVKRMQYMMQLTIPLYAAAFLFPTLAEDTAPPPWLAILAKPGTLKVFWALTLVVFGSQFVFNILSILNSAWIGVFVKP